MKRQRGTLFDFAFKASKVTRVQEAEEVSADDNADVGLARVEEPDCSESVEEEKEAADPTPSSSSCDDAGDKLDKGTSKTVSGEKKKLHLFQKEWVSKWSWIENKEDGMRCSVCTKHGKKNTFTSPGCFNYRTSTLERHANVRVLN